MVVSIFGNLIGDLLGSDEKSYNDNDIVSTRFRPGILVDLGIYWVQFVRKVLVAGAVVGSSAIPTSTKCDQICRASELPIYMGEDDCNQTSGNETLCPPKIGLIEGAIATVRRQMWTAMDKCSEYQREADDYYQKGSEYASSVYKYLSEEADDTTKMGVIGAGALTGLVLSLRRGIIRKLFFSGVGAYSMSAVCYPHQTADYTHSAIKETRKFATIGYNFVYGVKKDDISLPQLPKLPSSMGDVWEMAGTLKKSASSLITGSSTESKPVEVEEETQRASAEADKK